MFLKRFRAHGGLPFWLLSLLFIPCLGGLQKSLDILLVKKIIKDITSI
jgi:hypothetical protein